MLKTKQILWCILASSLSLSSCLSSMQRNDHLEASLPDELGEMDTRNGKAIAPYHEIIPDEATKRQFEKEYFSAGTQKWPEQ